MPTPGPWVQPADPLRGGNTRGWDMFTAGASLADVQVGAAGLTGSTSTGGLGTAGSSNLTKYWPPTEPAGGPWAAELGLVRLVVAGASLAPVPPTTGELAQPHVVGYEYEGGPGALSTLVGPVAVTLGLSGAFGTSTVFDLADQTVMTADVRLLDPAFYSFDVSGDPHPVSWVPALSAVGMPLLANPAFLATGSVTFTTPWTGVDPVVLVSSNYWINGIDFATAPAAGNNLALNFGPSWFVGAYVHPPRYRLLYDRVPPLRQFPRNDGLTGTSVARQHPSGASSLQASPRQRPEGYL